MNFLLNSGRENAVTHPGNGFCSYSNNIFKDPRAVGVHLGAHQGHAFSSKSCNRHCHSSNSLNITRSMPDSVMSTQSMSVIRVSGNHPNVASFNKAARLPVSPKRSGHENWLNRSNFLENSIGNTKSPISLSSNFLPGSDRTEIFRFQSWSYQLLSPHPNTVPLNHSVPSGSDAVLQFNSDLFRSFGDGGKFSENVFPSIQYQAQGTYLGTRLGSNRQSSLWEPTNTGPFVPYQNPYPGLGEDLAESGGYNRNHIMTHGGKRRYSGEDPSRPAMIKRPRLDYSLMIEASEHQKSDTKELLLFKDVEYPVSTVGKSIDANKVPDTYLDLSLHL